MFRGDSMKSLFIILIIFSLFISGCELFEEGEPQFSMRDIHFMEIAVCDHGENCGIYTGGGGGGSGGGNINYEVLNDPSCTDYNEPWYMPGWDASCSQEGIYNAPIFCGQDLTGTDCSSCYIASTSSYCNSEELGGCYCIGDGVCNDGISAPDYGETTSSSDCDVPSHNECSGNNCISVPGTGTDDCNNPGTIDPMCIIETHLGCDSNGLCEEVIGPGEDHTQCSAIGNQCDKGVCLVGDVCQFVSGVVGESECRNDLECAVCAIESAYWEADTSEDTVVDGTEVSLTIVTNGHCNGEILASIRVYDEDYWTGDDTCCNLPAGQISGTIFETQWTSARCCVDEMDEVNPQFRFIAKLSDGSEVTYSERLKVVV